MTSLLLPLLSALAVMPLAQVQPGQKGYCLTEWSGGQKLRVPVEVVGVLEATRPAGNAILVRLADPLFADSGVVAGMSGSPVYVEDKLLGAVAFGWQFAREALAGVTPFEDMRTIPTPPPSPVAARRFHPEDLRRALAGAPPAQLLVPEGLPTPNSFLPLSLPMAEPPFTADLLRRLGLLAVPGGKTGEVRDLPEAGDMVAAVLVWGDAVIAAGGTLTAREGDTFYAFGHPLVAAGPVRLPAARARVLAVQRSFAVPFKIFSTDQPFGTFVADQPAGMVAVAGEAPAGLPLQVEVASEEGRRAFRFFLADVPILKPLLAAYLTAASLSFSQGPNSDLTVEVSALARFADGRQLTLRQVTASADAVARVATFVGALVGLLTNPPFPAPALTALDLELARRPHESALLLEAIPHRRRLRPGEQLSVTCRLQPRQGTEERRVVSITVPRSLPPGRVDLLVADGSAFAEYAMQSEKLAVQDFSQLLGQLSRLEPSSTLVVALEAREGGLSLPGGALPALPPSLAASWYQALSPGLVQRLTTSLVAVERLAYPRPLAGALRIPLDITTPEAP